jgi:hypothetical protein
MVKIAISKRNEYAYTGTPQDRKRNEAEKGKNSFSEAKKNFQPELLKIKNETNQMRGKYIF